MIAIDTVREAAFQIMSKAGIEIPEDYQQGIQKMTGSETGPLSCFVLESMLQNWNVANEDRRPMCADTGVPRYAFLCVAILWVLSVVIMLMTNAATKRRQLVAEE